VGTSQADALRARGHMQRTHSAEQRVRDAMKELDAANKNLAACNEQLEDTEYAERSGAVLAPADGSGSERQSRPSRPVSSQADCSRLAPICTISKLRSMPGPHCCAD